MTKLYKVTVNNWGRSAPKTIYTTSKEAAEKIASQYPASDPVQYAGRYADDNAKKSSHNMARTKNFGRSKK